MAGLLEIGSLKLISPDGLVEKSMSITNAGVFVMPDSAQFTGTIILPNTTSIGDVSATEISCLDGITSSVQTQLNSKAPINSPVFSGTPQIGTNAIWHAGGGVWNPGANFTLNQTANSQEWSIDINRNGYTGGYWQIYDSSLGGLFQVYPETGNVYIAGTLTEASTIRVKENIRAIDNSLDIINLLNGVIYDRKDNGLKDESGLIAEEVEKILPNIVSYDENNLPSGVNYTRLIPYLLESIKELSQKIEELEEL